MPVYMITYDLVKPDHDYGPLIKAIESFKNHLHELESIWFVISDKNASQIRSSLLPYIHSEHDKLIVARLVRDVAWTISLSQEAQSWLTHCFVSSP